MGLFTNGWKTTSVLLLASGQIFCLNEQNLIQFFFTDTSGSRFTTAHQM